jgi:hypothetical protein
VPAAALLLQTEGVPQAVLQLLIDTLHALHGTWKHYAWEQVKQVQQQQQQQQQQVQQQDVHFCG